MAFSDVMFGYFREKAEWEDGLCDLGFGNYDRIGGDDYDNSIEFYKVAADARLNEAQQKYIYDAGFSIAFVNHIDGWETHYTWRGEFKPVEGWRRKRTDKGFLISFWPEGWGKPDDDRNGWLASGYMTIVPEERPTSEGGGTED